MPRRNWKGRKKDHARKLEIAIKQVPKEPKERIEPPQLSRGETIKHRIYGGYSHSFN